jgi:beta-N-acetylhexosaminidase
MAMTAHITYSVVDKNNCATMSKAMINIIRDNIGFDGLLMSDDFSMKALDESFTTRTEQCFYAGCDVALHCNGDFDEMLEIAASLPLLSDEGLKRLKRATGLLEAMPTTVERDVVKARVKTLLENTK